jgi:hypothetical protein
MSEIATTGFILSVLIIVYAIAMHFSYVITRRADQILSGVVEGTPMSLKARWMALWCQWVTWVGFLVGFLWLVALGVFIMANMVESREVALFSRICAGFAVVGGFIWLALGATYIVHMFAALRKHVEAQPKPRAEA